MPFTKYGMLYSQGCFTGVNMLHITKDLVEKIENTRRGKWAFDNIKGFIINEIRKHSEKDLQCESGLTMECSTVWVQGHLDTVVLKVLSTHDFSNEN